MRRSLAGPLFLCLAALASRAAAAPGSAPATLPARPVPASAPASAPRAAAAPSARITASPTVSPSKPLPAVAPPEPAAPGGFLARSQLAVAMGAEIHEATPLPLDWQVSGESRVAALLSAELAGAVSNGARYRNRIDHLSFVAGVALHPLGLYRDAQGGGLGARLLDGLALDAGLSIEVAHVGPAFQYDPLVAGTPLPALSLGAHLDLPLAADGRLALRLAVRHFVAAATTFPGPMGGLVSYAPPSFETFAGLSFRL